MKICELVFMVSCMLSMSAVLYGAEAKKESAAELPAQDSIASVLAASADLTTQLAIQVTKGLPNTEVSAKIRFSSIVSNKSHIQSKSALSAALAANASKPKTVSVRRPSNDGTPMPDSFALQSKSILAAAAAIDDGESIFE